MGESCLTEIVVKWQIVEDSSHITSECISVQKVAHIRPMKVCTIVKKLLSFLHLLPAVWKGRAVSFCEALLQKFNKHA